MKHRIFVAIGIPNDLQEEILRWEKLHEKLPVRWLSGKNLHITLVPPWHEEDIKTVAEKLTAVHSAVSPFELAFNEVAYGPDARQPRLIWAEGKTPKELPALKATLEHALEQKPENRLFRLHLTLARFRTETFSSFPVKQLNEKISWRDTAHSFILMESHLAPGGADYEILQEFAL